MGKLLCVALLVCVGAMVLADCSYGRVFRIRKPEETDELKRLLSARVEREMKLGVKDRPSKREILKSRRHKGPYPLGVAEQDVLRICAIRVEFETVADPSKISGNGGKFDLSDQRGTVPIDPAPHDRAFYSKHMEALAYYYSCMSYGKLRIDWEVFPLDNEGAYAVGDAADYNPGGGAFTWTVEDLERFFTDAILAANDDPELTFGEFDAVVVIHAGSDAQNDINRDTPYDLPSFFISLADTIEVDGGAHIIVDGSVVPETTSQDGYFNGINGVIAHEVGHQLGLADFYDAWMGLSAVGYWCLMDFGSSVGVVLEDTLTSEAYYVSGIVPASLCAWNKAYLGWARPQWVTDEGSFTLRATELQGTFPSTDMLAVPINSFEYYLIENRQGDLDGDGIGYLLTDPSKDSTGVIMGPVDEDRELNYEFDFILPGSGLLIWHVDDVVMQSFNPYDLINAFPERRAVSLEEADGIPDLGDYNSFYLLGSPDDPFRQGNNDRFASDTNPATTSNTGCHSHIVIDGITESDISMSLHIAFEWGSQGFPIGVDDSLRFGVPSLLVWDIDGDGADEIMAAMERADWDSTLAPDYSTSEVCGFEIEGGEARLIPGWPKSLGGSHPTEITGIDLDGDSRLEIAIGDESGRLYAFKPNGEPYFDGSDPLGSFFTVRGAINGVPVAGSFAALDGVEALAVATDSALYLFADIAEEPLIWSVADSSGFSQPVVCDIVPSTPGSEIVCYRPGQITAYAYGSQIEVLSLPVSCNLDACDVYLAMADIDRDPDMSLEVILAGKNGWVWVVDTDGGILPGWGRKLLSTVAAPPAVADMNGDGYLELVISDEEGRTWLLLHTSAGAEGWPISWYGCGLYDWDTAYYAGSMWTELPSPIVADLDCDGSLNVIQGSLFECITGWEPSGLATDGFPVTLSGGCSSIALGDVDGDGRRELLAGDSDGRMDWQLVSAEETYEGSVAYSDGLIRGLLHPGASSDCDSAPWPMAYFDRARNSVYPLRLMPDEPVVGERLLVRGSFHAFPNPAGREYNDGRNSITFTFSTDTGGVAVIDVFDITGVRVKRIEYDATMLETDVVVPNIDISDLGSGLYVCRLNLAGSDGHTVSEVFKLAVKR
jgi:M6 family metalloprotease-like protein